MARGGTRSRTTATAALRSAAEFEEIPRDGIGITSGRGDEKPQVGGGQQLSCQLTVLDDHRVDVGGIKDGQPRRNRVVRNQLK